MSMVAGLFRKVGDVSDSFDESEEGDLKSHLRHEKRRYSNTDRRITQILVLVLLVASVELPVHLTELEEIVRAWLLK